MTRVTGDEKMLSHLLLSSLPSPSFHRIFLPPVLSPLLLLQPPPIPIPSSITFLSVSPFLRYQSDSLLFQAWFLSGAVKVFLVNNEPISLSL